MTSLLLVLAAIWSGPMPELKSPAKMIEAIHGPYHGCLQWFTDDTGVWRTDDPQRWDTASDDEYTPGTEPLSTWWTCDVDPKFLQYDLDSDGDIDLRDYSLFINQWSKDHAQSPKKRSGTF